MAYATLANVREYLGIATANTGDDTLLTALIARAQAIIDSIAGYSFEAATATRYYNPDLNVDERGDLVLDYPLLTVTTLTNGDGNVVTASQYVLRPTNATPKYAIRLKPSTGLVWVWVTDPDNAITVVGTWGYSTTAPADILMATLRLVGYLYKQRDAQVFDVTAMTNGGIVTIPAGIPSDVLSIVSRYRMML
jgi:hypothetical protein